MVLSNAKEESAAGSKADPVGSPQGSLFAGAQDDRPRRFRETRQRLKVRHYPSAEAGYSELSLEAATRPLFHDQTGFARFGENRSSR